MMLVLWLWRPWKWQSKRLRLPRTPHRPSIRPPHALRLFVTLPDAPSQQGKRVRSSNPAAWLTLPKSPSSFGWQQNHSASERDAKAYYLAARDGDWRVESYITERVRKLPEPWRPGQEEAMRGEHERPPLKVEKRLAAALDTVIAMLPADERQRLEAEVEARVRQQKPVHDKQVAVSAKAPVLRTCV